MRRCAQKIRLTLWVALHGPHVPPGGLSTISHEQTKDPCDRETHPHTRRTLRRSAAQRPRSRRPLRDPFAPGLGVRRHPQRNDHGRGTSRAQSGPGDLRLHRPVAHIRVHAGDGGGHPRHRIPAATLPRATGVHHGDGALQFRHPPVLPRLRFSGTVGGAHRPGRGHGHHDAAADDHGAQPRARRPARPHHGQHLHRHLRGPRGRPDPVGSDPGRPRLALALRAGAAHRHRGTGAGSTVHPQRHRTECRRGRPTFRPGVGMCLRWARLRFLRSGPKDRGRYRDPAGRGDRGRCGGTDVVRVAAIAFATP